MPDDLIEELIDLGPRDRAPDGEEVPDFWIHSKQPVLITKAWNPEQPESLPELTAITTTTLEDFQQDIFEKSAIQGIQRTSVPGMYVVESHRYGPSDYIGDLVSYGEMVQGRQADDESFIEDPNGPEVGLRLTTNLDMEFPSARNTEKFARKKKKLGWSVGVKYVEARRRMDSRGVIAGFRVKDAAAKEHSVTLLPSNPGAWVEQARVGLVRKGIFPPNERDMRKLAYYVKHHDGFSHIEALALLRYADLMEAHYGISMIPNPRARHVF